MMVVFMHIYINDISMMYKIYLYLILHDVAAGWLH
jgi:hypothetical protein